MASIEDLGREAISRFDTATRPQVRGWYTPQKWKGGPIPF